MIIVEGTTPAFGSDNKMLYTPEYVSKSGEIIVQTLYIPIGDTIVIAKGMKADLFALNLNEGKEMWFDCDNERVVQNFTWGRYSKKTLEREIADINYEGPGGISTGEGLRPKDWWVVGSKDQRLWAAIVAIRHRTVFCKIHLDQLKFGFATVVPPEHYKEILFNPYYNTVYKLP